MRQLNGMLEDDGILFLQIAGLRAELDGRGLHLGHVHVEVRVPRRGRLDAAQLRVQQPRARGLRDSQRREHRDPLLDHDRPLVPELAQNREKVVASYGERWFRLWEIFLAWSVIIAERGGSTAFQLVCNKNRSGLRPEAVDWRARPPGRFPEELTRHERRGVRGWPGFVSGRAAPLLRDPA